MAKATRLRAPKVRHLTGQSDRAVNANGCEEWSAEGATPEIIDKYNRCRSLAFPSAADLFDVQTSIYYTTFMTALADCPFRWRAYSPRRVRK